MDKLEYKSIPFQLSDLDKEHGVAVIAHATYDNIDRLNDISRPGMFNKSWQEHKADIGFMINHDPLQVPGTAQDVWEDKAHAYTKVKFGNWTVGKDTLEMVDAGVIKDASFSFKAIKFNRIDVKGRKVRELKEVYHGETSLIYGIIPINPESGVVLVKKGGEKWMVEIFERINNLENFCRNTTASDDCIKKILQEVKALKQLVTDDDTADTHDDEPDASEEGDDMQGQVLARIKLLHTNMALS